MFHYVPYTTALTNYYSDNGPEVNCGPEGRCGSGATGKIPPGTLHRPHSAGPGSAGVLRGRKVIDSRYMYSI